MRRWCCHNLNPGSNELNWQRKLLRIFSIKTPTSPLTRFPRPCSHYALAVPTEPWTFFHRLSITLSQHRFLTLCGRLIDWSVIDTTANPIVHTSDPTTMLLLYQYTNNTIKLPWNMECGSTNHYWNYVIGIGSTSADNIISIMIRFHSNPVPLLWHVDRQWIWETNVSPGPPFTNMI